MFTYDALSWMYMADESRFDGRLNSSERDTASNTFPSDGLLRETTRVHGMRETVLPVTTFRRGMMSLSENPSDMLPIHFTFSFFSFFDTSGGKICVGRKETPGTLDFFLFR